MGLRGPGARPLKVADSAFIKPKRGRPKRSLTRAEAVIDFIQRLPITKGKLAGTTFKLLPNQLEFIEAVYTEDPVRLAVLSAPRGNGKTGLISALVLAHLLGPESERRGEIYSAAIDRLQAALVFAEVEAVVTSATPKRSRSWQAPARAAFMNR